MTPKQQTNIITRLVAEQIAKQVEDIRKQTIQQMYAVTLKNLHDRYNFTPNELVSFFQQNTNDFECINGKYVKIEDFYKLLEGMGIKVR